MPVQNLINFEVEGEGYPLLLIHGWAASLLDWEGIRAPLVQAGYRVYIPDLLGHGDSAKPPEAHYYHTRYLYSALDAWIDGLSLPQPPVMVGHSIGGYLALRYALGRPEGLRGLALISPLFSPGQLSPAFRLFRRRALLGEHALRLAPEWLLAGMVHLDPTRPRPASPRLRQRNVLDLKRADPQIIHILYSIQDLEPELVHINQPALVIWGDHDLSLRPSYFPKLAKALRNSSSQMIPGCGHQPHVAYPELTAGWLLDFLAAL